MNTVNDMVQFLTMMAVVVAMFGTVRYLSLRAARSDTDGGPD